MNHLVKESGKKASMAGLAGIILVLAVFIILIIYFIKASGTMSGNADRDTCRMSVLANAIGKEVFVSGSVFQPECKTYNIRFYNDHVEKNGKTIEVYDSRKKENVKKFSSLTEDIIYRVVAEEYRWCWYQFLEGQKSIYKWSFWGSTSSTCFICAEISFADDIDRPPHTTHFVGFLLKNNMPKTNMTYLDYLTPIKAIEGFSNIFEGEDAVAYLEWLNYVPVYDSPNYVLLFKSKKNSVFFHKILGFLGIPEFEGMVLTDSTPSNLHETCDDIKRGAVK